MRFSELPLLLPEPDMLTEGLLFAKGRRGERCDGVTTFATWEKRAT